MADVILFLAAILATAHHGGPGSARNAAGFGDRRQGDQVIASEAGDVLDEDVVASHAQIDSVLVEDRLPDAVDQAGLRGGEIEIPQRAVGTSLQRDGPTVRLLHRDVLDAEIFDHRQEDADIAPVAGLALPILAGVGAISPLAECLAAVAGCAGMFGAFQDDRADPADVDVLHRPNISDAEAAIGAADHVVATTVGKFDPAVVQFERGIAPHQDGRVEEPGIPTLLALDVDARNDHAAAEFHSDVNRLIDPLDVGPLELVWSDDKRRLGRRVCLRRRPGIGR